MEFTIEEIAAMQEALQNLEDAHAIFSLLCARAKGIKQGDFALYAAKTLEIITHDDGECGLRPLIANAKKRAGVTA
jgi:hypothetical protein